MIQFEPLLRALGLTLALSDLAPAPLPAAPPKPPRLPQATLATRLGDPACWSTFAQCLEYLEHWGGRVPLVGVRDRAG